MGTDALDRFRVEYQEYHQLSPSRIREQQKVLRAFEDHAGKSLLECSGEEFAAYMAELVSQGQHVNTVRKKGNMIRPFFNWAYARNLISGETLMSIKTIRNPKGSSGRTQPKPYSRKDLARWRKELDKAYPLLPPHRINYYWTGRAGFKRIAKHAYRVQVEAIVGLALYCGLRRAEIYALSIDDMHPDNAYVVVENGKGGKPREVPHTKSSRERVGAWLDLREKLMAMEPAFEDHGRPWLSLSPRQTAPGWLKPMRYRRYEQLLTGVGDWHLHRFRHTCATNWLRAGMSLETVSRLLGHSNIQQTLCYTAIVRDDIQRAVERLEDTFEDQVNGGDE